MRRIWIAGMLACALEAPVVAWAQDESGFGLDLTDAKPPEGASGFGLDLSAGVDYRPPVVYLGVAMEDASSGPDAKNKALLTRLDDLLLSTIRKASQFCMVQVPEGARAKLGGEADESLRCPDPDCFDTAASKLGAERLFVGLLSLTGGKPHVRLVAYARGQDRIESQDVPVEAALKAATAAKVVAAAKLLFVRVAEPFGRLKASTNVPAAEISLDGVVLGKGSAETFVRAGRHSIGATASGYEPQSFTVQVQSGQTKELTLELTRVPPPAPVAAVTPPKRGPEAPKAPKAAPDASFTQKPGLYVALAGVVAAGAGLAFGISAQGTAGRAVDANGDGILDVTRAEMLSAQTNALLANVLVPAGLAMTAGGAAWMFWPTAKVGRGPGAPEEPQVGVAITGTF